MKRQLLTVALFAMSLLGYAAYAQSGNQSYNQVSFSTQVSQNVANDELYARLSKTAQSTTAKELANTLNQSINTALDIAKKYPEVKVSTSKQNTYPRYNKNGTITGFTGSVSLEIRSQNFAKASELIAELQAMMTVDTLVFKVSDNARQQAKTELMKQATKHFLDEAYAVSQAFGAKGYNIINVNLDSDYPAQNYAMDLRMASSASKEVAPQEFESGDSKLTYRASGTIELIR